MKVTRCLTCDEEFSSACGLSGAVGGSDGKSSAVCGGHGGDPQNSAAIAERDLNAGQSCGRKNLAITEPADLRKWRTWRGQKTRSSSVRTSQTTWPTDPSVSVS